MRKYYSLDEANEKIADIKPRILQLIKLSKAIDLLDSIDIQYSDEFETIKQDVAMNKKFHEYSLNFCKEVETLLKQGIVLRDIEQGLVNFFAMHANKELFLCWKINEEQISTFYETDSSYEFRKPVSELKTKKKVQ